MPRSTPFPSLRHEVDRLFDSLIHSAWGSRPGDPCWMPAVDVTEEPERYRIEIDLPGLRYSDVSICAEGRWLRVEGVRERVRRSTPERHHVLERSTGRFVRTFHLPDDADARSIRAGMAEGVLSIEIPREGEGGKK